MTNQEGFLFIVLLASFTMILIGCITLAIAYFFLTLVKKKLLRIIIILAGIVLNFTLFVDSDISWLILGAVCFAVPMTVLAPLVFIPDRLRAIPTFPRILRCYLIISALDTVLPFFLIAAGINMIPFLYWATPLSNSLVYICLMTGCFGVAVTVYQLINRSYIGSSSFPKVT